MYKLVTFDGYDNRFGPHIFPIEPDVNRTIGHIKMARPLPPRVENYIRTASPIAGKTQLLIDAMGSGEFYGSNVNGDYFPDAALSHQGADYGFQTFEHFAYPFKHHVNKDPARAYGDKVTLADWDPEMHRVLLIVRVDDSKCQDILGDLASGRYWDVSMGCRVPWDECSICKNKARNRAEYCPHLRYQMNRILPDGRRVCAYNWMPKFFDISFVTIGAEKASHVLAKVAHQGQAIEVYSSAALGESFYAKLAAADKAATEKKTADIDKEVPADAESTATPVTTEDKQKVQAFMNDAGAVKGTEQELPPELLDQLAGFPLRNVFATLATMGIDLRPQEFQRIILVKQGSKKLADAFARHRLVFDEYQPGAMPKWAGEFANLQTADANEKIAMLLRPYLEKRSCFEEILERRLEEMSKRADDDSNPSVLYNRSGQWYPMSDEARRKSSGMPGLVPASLALAAGFMVFRRAFPELMAQAPSPVKAISQHPWLLPMLISAGVGASVGMGSALAPRALNGTGAGLLDGKSGAAYHQRKTAGITSPVHLGLIPLAYINAGVQEKRASRSDHLGWLDQLGHQKHAASTVMRYALALDTPVANIVHRLAKRKKEHDNGHSR